MTDLIGGHIPAAVDTVTNALPHHQSGKLRILATAGTHRSPYVPDVPTVAEFKIGAVLATELVGFYVPKQVSAARVQELSDELLRAGAKAKDRIASIQLNPESVGSRELADYTRRELQRWKGVVEASGFKINE
jgi:tripartite-type tricarboxylate transporter receptor subunit TctC